MRVAPGLATLRGAQWTELIERVCRPEAEPVEQITFVLMMVRLSGCVTCNADSFRAMRGCTHCARQSVRRYRGSDQNLSDQYQTTRLEVEAYFSKHAPITVENGEDDDF